MESPDLLIAILEGKLEFSGMLATPTVKSYQLNISLLSKHMHIQKGKYIHTSAEKITIVTKHE